MYTRIFKYYSCFINVRINIIRWFTGLKRSYLLCTEQRLITSVFSYFRCSTMKKYIKKGLFKKNVFLTERKYFVIELLKAERPGVFENY